MMSGQTAPSFVIIGGQRRTCGGKHHQRGELDQHRVPPLARATTVRAKRLMISVEMRLR